MTNHQGATMNRRQALTLSGLLTGTILTGGAAATGLLHATHTQARPTVVWTTPAPSAAATPAPVHHDDLEGVD